VCCDEQGLATFQLLRHRRNEPQAVLYALDLLELNGTDLRREPIEVRKATLARILRKSRSGVRVNEHRSIRREPSSSSTPAKMGLEGIVSKRPSGFLRRPRSLGPLKDGWSASQVHLSRRMLLLT
jgi:bifunctional non-homologous end joining protein LigD